MVHRKTCLVCVIVVAYVTAGARIHLYRYLDRVRENAIYCDTEAVIYIQLRGETPVIETGDKLRDTTIELCPSEDISEFVSGGPKNYAYRMLTGDGRVRLCLM